MNTYAPAARYKPDNIVARNRIAAARKAHKAVINAAHLNAGGIRFLVCGRIMRGNGRLLLVLRSIAVTQTRNNLCRRYSSEADSGIHFIHAGKTVALEHRVEILTFEKRRCRQ